MLIRLGWDKVSDRRLCWNKRCSLGLSGIKMLIRLGWDKVSDRRLCWNKRCLLGLVG